MSSKVIIFLIIALLAIMSCARIMVNIEPYDYSKMNETTKKVHQQAEQFLVQCITEKYPLAVSRDTRVDSVNVDKDAERIDVYFNSLFAYVPLREDNVLLVYQELKKYLGRKFRKYSLTIYSNKYPLEQLIPNLYRADSSTYDVSRMPQQDVRSFPVVMNMSKPYLPANGLFNRNIALWHSHGWYYEQLLNRWEWQRARLFQTVEDIGPIAFTIPYIIPMLENAGATVFLPRERDIQVNEVIIDNDTPDDWETFYIEEIFDNVMRWNIDDRTSGFAIGNPPYTIGINPFHQGTYRIMNADSVASVEIDWIPEIPQPGNYAVYISYHASDSCVTDARYTVYHTGGKTEFFVNQQIGGGTWIYLGTFTFDAGYDPQFGKVLLTNQSTEFGDYVTADAVRFGGGMGNVARNGMTSKRPRFVEGARYYLQYAGFPDTLVFSLNEEENDYKDDYQSRGEWVNYLKGAPFGPNKDRSVFGLGIPVDLSLAFHTDAGISKHDTVIGTLSIYCTQDAESTDVFPDGMSRLANRDFADILQTQIVSDLQATWDSTWNRRGLWDRDYSEAFRPNVPAALLELLSHQSFLDMKFYHEPQFKFDASRSIYKAMLKFIATQYRYYYVVQPLPVTHFQIAFTADGGAILRWKPTYDPLEPSAVPEQYIVYRRIEDNNFDNGVLVNVPEYLFDYMELDVIYSFKVTAVNRGGESFPSEILSACRVDNDHEPVLIINGFDRISGPATIESDTFVGFANFWDQGVPDRYDLGFTGDQFNFTPTSKWKNDDAPGHGASHANLETTVIAGNTFDFPYVHGMSIVNSGYPFISVSDEVVIDSLVDITQFKIIDLILGEEKSIDLPKPQAEKRFKAFPQKLQQELTGFCKTGGNIFVSGAYIGTDLFDQQPVDSADIEFARSTLKYFWRTNHASKTGGVWIVDSTFAEFDYEFRYNSDLNPHVYAVEAPDAIEPADSLARTILRYSENNISAGIAYPGADYRIIAFGFPFETILAQEKRDYIMGYVLDYLDRHKP